jgi:hypothetical protein
MVASSVFKYGLPLLVLLSVGMLGRTRRIGFWGGVIFSMLLTPIGGLLLAYISGPRRIPVEKKYADVRVHNKD